MQRKHETVAAEIETTKERIQNLRKALADAEADLLKWKGREAELPEIPDVEAIRSRLDRMREELRFADRYEFQVINDDVGRAVAEIGAILQRREAERNA